MRLLHKLFGRSVPRGYHGVNVFSTGQPENAPEPVGLPVAAVGSPLRRATREDGEYVIKVWVHARQDGEKFVHPDTVFEMLRAMLKGPAAPTFCDLFELELRRLMDSVTSTGRGSG